MTLHVPAGLQYMTRAALAQHATYFDVRPARKSSAHMMPTHLVAALLLPDVCRLGRGCTPSCSLRAMTKPTLLEFLVVMLRDRGEGGVVDEVLL